MYNQLNENNICYLDLIGIKEIAKINTNKYHNSMNLFTQNLIDSLGKVDFEDHDSNFKINFFSDCCVIEAEDLILLLRYLIKLRKALAKDNGLFFSAAITHGTLKSVHISEGLEDLSKLEDMFSDPIKRLKELRGDTILTHICGTIFQSADISKAYMLQSEFKGIGVFIDSVCIEKMKQLLNSDEYTSFYKKYISESFFFPSINTNTVKRYFDLKFSESELKNNYYKNAITKYYKANSRNKKYGRFYIPLIANFISSSNFRDINIENGISKKLNNVPLIYENLTEKDFLVEELKKNAHYFEYLYFFLLGILYKESNLDSSGEWNNSVTSYYIESVLYCFNQTKRYLSKLDTIPDAVLNSKHREMLLDDHQKFLEIKSDLERKKAQKRSKSKDKR